MTDWPLSYQWLTLGKACGTQKMISDVSFLSKHTRQYRAMFRLHTGLHCLTTFIRSFTALLLCTTFCSTIFCSAVFFSALLCWAGQDSHTPSESTLQNSGCMLQLLLPAVRRAYKQPGVSLCVCASARGLLTLKLPSLVGSSGAQLIANTDGLAAFLSAHRNTRPSYKTQINTKRDMRFIWHQLCVAPRHHDTQNSWAEILLVGLI